MKRAPSDLGKRGKAYWRKSVKQFDFQEVHEFELLKNLCVVQDEKHYHKQKFEKEGRIYIDRWNAPKPHASVKNYIDLCKLEIQLIRELGLDLADTESRPNRRY